MNSAKDLCCTVSIVPRSYVYLGYSAYLSGVVLGNSALLRGSVCMRRETVGHRQRNLFWAIGGAQRSKRTSQNELTDSGNETGEEGVVGL